MLFPILKKFSPGFREPMWTRLHSRDLLPPEQGLPQGAQRVRSYVRCAGGFGGGVPVYGTHVAAAGIRSGGGRIRAEGHDARSEAARGAPHVGRALSVQIARPEAIEQFQKELTLKSCQCGYVLQAGRRLLANPEIR